MNISRTKAEIVADKMVSGRFEKLRESEKELSNLITQAALETLPELVQDCFKNHGKYMQTGGYVKLIGPNGDAFDHQVRGPFNWGAHVQLSEARHSLFRKSADAHKKEEQAINQLRRDIINALLKLKTYNRVKEQFSEAYEHLPEKTETALSIPVADIRKRLNNA
jgi:hypothetical protein